MERKNTELQAALFFSCYDPFDSNGSSFDPFEPNGSWFWKCPGKAPRAEEGRGRRKPPPI